MFERFTDRARRVVVLSQEEARLLKHGHIGTEHLLLGLIREEQGIAARALAALGIELDAVRDRVSETLGAGGEAGLEGHIPFTPRAKRVLELSLREALQLGHDYIGTEHILLGLVREGHGEAARVLVELGADLNVVRQRVVGMLHVSRVQAGRGGRREPAEVTVARRAVSGRMERTLASSFRVHLREIEARLSAVEQRVGFGPDVSELDREIVRVLGEKHAAADAQDYEQAAELRDAERRLAAEKAAKQGEWATAHPDLVALAEAVERLEREVGRLRQLLRERGIEPEDRGEQGGAA
jgi:ATP-dependent Clp protease ATP-binding subunit ClpA